LLAGLVVLLAIVTHAASQSSSGADAAVYRRPLGHDPVTLDPPRISDVYGRSVAHQLFDGLVQFDQTLTVTPALAEFWRGSRDGLTWTFTLRKGVKFHHGREVTSDDVVFSFTRLLDPRVKSSAADLFTFIKGADEYRRGRAKHVSGLAAVDRYTVQVTLKEAPAPFVSFAAVGAAKILPRDLVEAQGEAFGQRPIGTGPFRFVSWERGREIVLAANSEYFDGAPRLARVVYRIFAGGRFDTVNEEFERGALEDAPLPPKLTAAEYRRLVADPRHVYVKRSMFSLRFYGFNTRLKPLDDPRVRQAINHAIDRTTINDAIYLGRTVIARGILPPGTPGYNPSLAGYRYDPARARELLAAAGHAGGRGVAPITFWSAHKDERIVAEHEMIRRSLEAIGIRAEFSYLTDWPAFSRMLPEGKMPVFLYAWFADAPDPDNFLAMLFHSKSPRNFTGYANPSVDALLEQARRPGDPLSRVELYRRAEKLIVDDAPIVPFWHYTYERRFQPYVKSIEVSGLGDPYIPLRKVWLDRR
jgi:peptide/nickel transport system substrate-binding protein/oligopeptide transport system substrate-binding protein